MDLHNAELALRRARSDLATQVRNAYFAVLVAKETVRVNRALAHFTDEVYRLQAQLLAGGFAAPYEPAALRAQAYQRAAGLQAVRSRPISIPGSNSWRRSTCGNCRCRKWPAASIRPSPTTIMTPSWPTCFATTPTC